MFEFKIVHFEFKSLGDFGVLPKSGRILEDPPKSPSQSCPAYRIVKINHLLSLYLIPASLQGERRRKKKKRQK